MLTETVNIRLAVHVIKRDLSLEFNVVAFSQA